MKNIHQLVHVGQSFQHKIRLFIKKHPKTIILWGFISIGRPVETRELRAATLKTRAHARQPGRQ